MSSTKPLMKGRYVDIVRAKAFELVGRAGGFTVNSLCHETGLKPTGNLRRRLAEMVYNGELGYTAGYSESGYIVGNFHEPIRVDVIEQTHLPF